jgi:hypothetical protein
VVSSPPNGIDYEQLNVDITLVEIQQAFKKLKQHKVIGIDGITKVPFGCGCYLATTTIDCF